MSRPRPRAILVPRCASRRSTSSTAVLPGDDHVDPARLAEAVRSLDADVLALQEVDRNQPRSGGADLTAVAAEAMGAVDHRFVAALLGTPGDAWVPATGPERPDRPAYGIALLSRVPVASWRVVRLPALRAPVPERVPGRRLPTLAREEPRVGVVAEISSPSPSGPVTVANTHLSFLPWWNRHQLRALVAAVASAPRPVLVLGDLNMGPEKAGALSGLCSAGATPDVPGRGPDPAARPRARRRSAAGGVLPGRCRCPCRTTGRSWST